MIKYFIFSALFISCSVLAAPGGPTEPERELIRKTVSQAAWVKKKLQNDLCQNPEVIKFLELIDMQQYLDQEVELLELMKRFRHPALRITNKTLSSKLENKEEKKEAVEFLKNRVIKNPSVLTLKELCNWVTPLDFSNTTVWKMPTNSSLEEMAKGLMPEGFFENSKLANNLGRLKTTRGVEGAVGQALFKYKEKLMAEREISAENIDYEADLVAARLMRNQLVLEIVKSSQQFKKD
jgi:hypothetical protein